MSSMLTIWRNYMNFEILSKTKVVGLQENSLTSFQNFMLENIAWDSQVRADYYQSNKNTVLLELPVRLRRDIQIENINGALDALVDFELIYKQDQGKLVSSLVVDTQYLLCINDQDIDLWSIDSELSFLQEADRNHLKKLMRHCDDRFHAWMREIKSYFNRLTVQPLHLDMQIKIRKIVGYTAVLPKTFP
jgi:hypothetical protein